MKKLAIYLVALYLLSQAFESVVRWTLDMAGLGPLIYARDAGLVLATLLCAALLVRDRQDVARSFWLMACFPLSACVAVASGIAMPQILFGFKIWLPFVCAFFLAETGAVGSLNRPRIWFCVWAILCSGIFVNYFYRFPWIGLTVQIGDVAISANREWSAFGVQRLSGFSRSSTDAATIILLLYTYLVVMLRGQLARTALTVVSGAAIALTTSKGALGAFCGCVLLVPMLAPSGRASPRTAKALASGLVAIGFVGAIAPLVSLQVPLLRLRADTLESWLFGSLLSRAWDTWPAALDLLSQQWQWITGRGIGGIGAAQGFFEPVLLNTADNLFVYLYVTAGLLGAALYTFYACAAFRLHLEMPGHRCGFLVLFCLLTYGLTTGLVESGTFALAMGGLLSALSQKTQAGVVLSTSMRAA